MKHIYRKGSDTNLPTLLLLHGTGGTEQDLLPLAEMIAPEASILSVRGNVLEHGMPRFFRRLQEGVFDIEDLILRTAELNNTITNLAEEYQFDRHQVLAIGYSNGANIAASLLYHHEKALRGAILLHAMVPREGMDIPNLSNVSVFIGAGKRDTMIPVSLTTKLSNELQQAGAEVTEYWTDVGHQITHEEVEQAKIWFDQQYRK